MTSLTDLIERVRSGSGEDRELDALVLCAVAAPEGSYVEQSKINGAWCIYDKPGRLWEKRGCWYRPEGWPLTTSLDAVVRLVEERRPGEATRYLELAIQWLSSGKKNSCEVPVERLPRAILLALLIQLQAQEGA